MTPDRTGNSLNGTCQLGQLLMRGYDQELRNGLHLRRAYAYDGNATADGPAARDARMRLWDATAEGAKTSAVASPAIGDPARRRYQEPNLRYRADDEQRTLMSGQVLLRGLFEPELLSAGDDATAVIRLHTADYDRDVLRVSERLCPRAAELREEAYASNEYRGWINSAEVAAVTAFARDNLGMASNYIDCLMTTICTDRKLPASVDDYDGSLGATSWEEVLTSFQGNNVDQADEGATNMFERLVNFVSHWIVPGMPFLPQELKRS